MKKKYLSREYILLMTTVAIFLLMSIGGREVFLCLRNFQSMSSQVVELGLFGFAVGICMIAGGIDLSVIMNANLSAILSGMFLLRYSGEINGSILTIITVCFALIIGSICGLLNGILITKLNITPILATLGTFSLFGGISIILTKGKSISGFPNEFLVIGNGTIGKIPVTFIIFILLTLIIYLLLDRTILGVSIYLVGTNPIAARFSGLNNHSILIRTYMIAGAIAGLAGIIMTSKFASARPDYGTAFLLPAILVVLLGGVDPAGGSGSVIGIFIAVVLLQLLQTGFNIVLGTSTFLKQAIWGFILVAVMIVDSLSKRRGKN